MSTQRKQCGKNGLGASKKRMNVKRKRSVSTFAFLLTVQRQWCHCANAIPSTLSLPFFTLFSSARPMDQNGWKSRFSKDFC